MITSDVLGALRRRWYLVLVGLLGTVGLMFAAHSVVPVTYQAKAMIVLLPPRNLDNTGGNPYLALGGLDSVAGVLSRSMTTEAIAEEVATVAPDATFTVEPDATTSGPVLLVTAEADSPAAALAATQKLIDVAPRQMETLQRASGVGANSFITTNLVTQDAVALPQHKAQIRALIAVGIAGITATVLGVAMIDGFLLRRRERRRLRVVDESYDDEEPPSSASDDDRRGGGRNGRSGSSGGGANVTEGHGRRTGHKPSKVAKGGRGVARTADRGTPPTRLGMAERNSG